MIRASLDIAFPNAPVYLIDDSAHNGLANSEALELAGINKRTSDPKGGRVIRDVNGLPTGELVGTATWLVTQFLPLPSPESARDAVRWAVKMCSRYGITSIQDASATKSSLATLKYLDEQDELNLRVAAHLVWGSMEFGDATQAELEELIKRRDRYSTEHVETDHIKLFIDGAPLPPHYTHAELDSITGKVELEDILIPSEKLERAVTQFDRRGIKVKMHVAGAGAARVALNAIAYARSKNGYSGLKHELAHTNFIAEEDINRLGPLDAIAEMSPAVWHLKGPSSDPVAAGFRFKSLLEAGALMTVGTDWPVIEKPNLFPALEGMLNRGEQSISLTSALKMMTINGAKSLGWDGVTGSIKRGKIANMIVLDRNLFEIPVQEISDTKVLKTLFEGKIAYDIREVK